MDISTGIFFCFSETSPTAAALVTANHTCFCGIPFDLPCPCDQKLVAIATAMEKKYMNGNQKK